MACSEGWGISWQICCALSLKWKGASLFLTVLALSVSQSRGERPWQPCGPCVCSGSDSGIAVDCSGRGLKHVPDRGLPVGRATTLSLRNNSIASLDPKVFKDFTSLLRLDLSLNIINNVIQDAFNGLGVLRELNLSCNLLTLDGDFSAGKTGPFNSLRSLTSLDLCNNSLSDMNESVFEHMSSNLTWLNIGQNDITYRSEETWPLRYLDNVVYLDLHGNNLTSVRREMFKHGLQSLNISYNKIPLTDDAYPPDAFAELNSSLVSLGMKGNWNTSNSSVPLNYPDQALSRLQHLQALWVDGIPGQGFGPGFRNMTSLTTLSLTGRYQGYCYVGRIGNRTFENLPDSLQTLDLSLCNLTLIEADAFVPLSDSLVTLSLSYNYLGFDGVAKAFFGLQGSVLNTLFIDSILPPLSKCVVVSKAHTRYFRNTSLETLYARNNGIELFCQHALNSMPTTLKRVVLYGNALGFGAYFKDLKNLVGLRDLEIDGRARAKYLPKGFPSDLIECTGSDRDQSLCTGGWTPYIDHFQHFGMDDGPGDMHAHTYLWQLHGSMASEGFAVQLPPKLTSFQSRYNQLYYVLDKIVIHPINSLRNLDLGNNLLTSWLGPIIGLDKLESLNLENNLAFEFSVLFFREMRSLKTLCLGRNLMRPMIEKDTEGYMFGNLSMLEHLDLNRNYLNVIPPKIFKELGNLRTLNLSKNSISTFNADIRHMGNLSSIDLSYNMIKSLPQETMDHLDRVAETINVTVNLTVNPLACTCQHMAFLMWMANSKVIQASGNYTCLMADGNFHNLTNIVQVIKELQTSCINQFGILVGAVSCAFCLLTALLSALAYRFRWKLRYLYYASRLAYTRLNPRANRNHDNDNDDGGDDDLFDFDAFVSYSSENNDFVHGEMLEELETRGGLRLNVHNRDFIPGRPIPSNIVSAVQSSRRTLVVLTEALLESQWCRYELQMASQEAAQTGRDVLLFLLYGDVPSAHLPAEVLYNLQASTYIMFPAGPQPPDVLASFWRRLVHAVKQ